MMPHVLKTLLLLVAMWRTVSQMTEPELAPATTAPIAKQPTRASGAQAAFAMIRERRAELDKRLPIYAAVEAAYDREPTDDRESLQIDGLGWTCTIDWGGMKAGVDQGALVDYNLATQPDTYVKLKPRKSGQGISERLAKIERADKAMLDEWSGWIPQLEMMVHNRRAHGLGIFHTPHPLGWHFNSVHPASLIYPKGAKIDIDGWDWFALKTEFKITDLLRRLEEKKQAEALGWNLGNVRKVIAKLRDGPEFLRGMMTDPEHYAVGLKTNDLSFAAKNKGSIPGYIFYVQEWTGKTSEHFVVDDENIGFLFSGVGRHESNSDCLSLFPLSMGQGFMERVRGYGVEMLPYHDTENRARNHLLDQLLISGVVMKSDGDDAQKAMQNIKHHGPFLFINDETTLSVQQLPDMSKSHMVLLSEMERTRSLNNQALGGTDHAQRNSDMSATQSRILHDSGSAAQSNEVARFYAQLGRFHKIRLRRSLQSGITEFHPGGKASLEMVKELTEDGVLLEDFKNIKQVRARTIFGDGNATNQWLAMQDIKELFGHFTASGKKAYVRRAVSARLRDDDLALELTGADGRVDETGQFNQWAAQMENNVFETSDTRQDLGPKDDHVIHLELHTVYAEEVVERKDLPLAEQFARVHRAQPHAAMHLGELVHDLQSQGAYKDYNQRWAVLVNWLRQAGQKLEAENQKRQAAELEELRTPRLSVKEQETAMTEKFKRDLALEESVQRRKHADELHTATMQQLADKRAMGVPVATPSASIDEYGRPIKS